MKKLIAIFALLIAAGGGTWYYYNYGQKKEKPTVVTAAVSRQDIVEVVQTTGTLEALRTVQVGSQVSGTVISLHGVDFNSIVKEGQKIAELDPTLLQVQVDLAKTNIEKQMGDIAQSRVQLENDKLNLERTKTQYDKQLVSKQALEAADLQVKSREASIVSAEKSVKQTQATLDAAELNVKYCTILSPVDGVVVDRKVDIGQTVQSSVNVAQFYTIATDLTNLKLTAMVDEAEIGKVRRGMPVSFTVESYGPQTFTGTVDAVRLNATTSNNVVTYPVWINVPNNDLKLRPSMTATARIIISTAESALRIPNGALRFKPNADIYASLGLTPPAPGQGRTNMAGNAGGQGGPAGGGGGRNQGGQGANGNPPADAAASQPAGAPGAPTAAAPPVPGAPGAQAAADAKAPGAGTRQPGQGMGQQTQSMAGRGGQPGQGGRGGQGTTFGQGQGQGQSGRTRGFGQGTQMTQAGAADFTGRGGRGGAGGGGRSGNGQGGRGGRTQTPANASGDTTPLNERVTATGAKAEKIDDLFQEPPHVTNRGSVWTWDEGKKELKQINITYGVSDGQFSELVTGDIQQGQLLVTNVIVPVNKSAAPGANPFMGQQPRGGGPGGLQPGGAGGGGGGGARGGGGGGRGGN